MLKTFYKLKCAKTKIPDETPSVQLDFEQIAADIHFRREIVEACIHETLLFFAGALRDKKEVEFSFKGIGILAVRRKAVSMTFLDDFLLDLDATGNMLAALLEVSLSFLRGSSSGLFGNAVKALSTCFLLAAVTCLATWPRHALDEPGQVSVAPGPFEGGLTDIKGEGGARLSERQPLCLGAARRFAAFVSSQHASWESADASLSPCRTPG
ncbi:hypothetical protein QYF61_011311 [Mycteria americana]|uniref:CCDC81 HU domain-containing protein n=1 Tax=Mycteria americana TaxID=33587 RepID=A0AAN7N1S6_MYCAM|nr:hypothetical protein QYF61_011310 [Mycteria americana]KAK4816087.1 hypothetical protein QYF61_011311 [Mycteria americana]